MHDIDRVLLETAGTAQEDEDEQFFEQGAEQFFEQEDEQYFEQEDEQYFEQEDEQSFEQEGGHEHALSEAQEIELANQAMEVGSEQELEQFLGDILKLATDQVGRFARSNTGRQLGGILKKAAIQALPVVGRAVAGPTGARAGSALGRAAHCFGLEMEAMNPEDREFELARRFVRLADCATRQALKRLNTAPPKLVAKRAATAAARRHAPGLALRSVLTAPPLRRTAVTAAPVPRVSRDGAGVHRVATTTRRAPRHVAGPAGATRVVARCHSCGGPLTTRSGRWVMRGDAVVLLPD
jgi:hypothetical protein